MRESDGSIRLLLHPRNDPLAIDGFGIDQGSEKGASLRFAFGGQPLRVSPDRRRSRDTSPLTVVGITFRGKDGPLTNLSLHSPRSPHRAEGTLSPSLSPSTSSPMSIRLKDRVSDPEPRTKTQPAHDVQAHNQAQAQAKAEAQAEAKAEAPAQARAPVRIGETLAFSRMSSQGDLVDRRGDCVDCRVQPPPPQSAQWRPRSKGDLEGSSMEIQPRSPRSPRFASPRQAHGTVDNRSVQNRSVPVRLEGMRETAKSDVQGAALKREARAALAYYDREHERLEQEKLERARRIRGRGQDARREEKPSYSSFFPLSRGKSEHVSTAGESRNFLTRSPTSTPNLLCGMQEVSLPTIFREFVRSAFSKTTSTSPASKPFQTSHTFLASSTPLRPRLDERRDRSKGPLEARAQLRSTATSEGAKLKLTEPTRRPHPTGNVQRAHTAEGARATQERRDSVHRRFRGDSRLEMSRTPMWNDPSAQRRGSSDEKLGHSLRPRRNTDTPTLKTRTLSGQMSPRSNAGTPHHVWTLKHSSNTARTSPSQLTQFPFTYQEVNPAPTHTPTQTTTHTPTHTVTHTPTDTPTEHGGRSVAMTDREETLRGERELMAELLGRRLAMQQLEQTLAATTRALSLSPAATSRAVVGVDGATVPDLIEKKRREFETKARSSSSLVTADEETTTGREQTGVEKQASKVGLTLRTQQPSDNEEPPARRGLPPPYVVRQYRLPRGSSPATGEDNQRGERGFDKKRVDAGESIRVIRMATKPFCVEYFQNMITQEEREALVATAATVESAGVNLLDHLSSESASGTRLDPQASCLIRQIQRRIAAVSLPSSSVGSNDKAHREQNSAAAWDAVTFTRIDRSALDKSHAVEKMFRIYLEEKPVKGLGDAVSDQEFFNEFPGLELGVRARPGDALCWEARKEKHFLLHREILNGEDGEERQRLFLSFIKVYS